MSTFNVDEFFAPAVKAKMKAKVALIGATGAGKSFVGLQWARVLAGPDGQIVALDTEHESLLLYAPNPQQLRDGVQRVNYWDPPFAFRHRAWPKPYDPARLTDIIVAMGTAGFDGVLLIDSLSHFWEGEGGTLERVDDVTERANSNNKFAHGWKTLTPIQRRLFDEIVRAPFHIICTMRSKMTYTVEEVRNRSGQMVQQPKKVGLQPVQRGDVEYEFTVVADISLPEHVLTVTKSRCSVIADRVAMKEETALVAVEFADWLNSGVGVIDADQYTEIADRINAITDEPTRRTVRAQFVTEFGLARDLTTDRFDAARAWLDRHGAPAAPQGNAAPADEAVVPPAADEVPADLDEALDNIARGGDRSPG